jgi:hypothetical protein
MANSIDIYSTRTMMQAIKIMKPAYSFFCDTFFGNVETYVTETVDFDFKKGKRKMAPFVAPRVGGIVMDRQGFETRTLKTPKIAPERVLTKDDLATRAMGEAVYSQRTPAERAVELLAADINELDEYITRREEWMCREVLYNGKIIIAGDGFEQQVDYNFTNKEVLSGAALWSASTSKPLQDLKRWRQAVIQKTGKAPNICILASDVADVFIENDEVKALLDKFRYSIMTVEPSIQSPAVTYIGRIASLGLELYTYDEWYIDDTDGTEKPMVPAGTVLLGSKGMNKQIYGAVTQMDNGQFATYEGTRIPKSWIDEQNEVRKLRLTSRHLPVPIDVDNWYVAVVK